MRVQRRLDHRLLFLVEHVIVGRPGRISQGIGPAYGILLFLFDPYLPVPMPEKPPALVMGFVDGDAEDPGFQAALAAKMAHIAENLEKHLLHHVGGVGRIVQQPQAEIINGLLEAQEQRLVGLL